MITTYIKVSTSTFPKPNLAASFIGGRSDAILAVIHPFSSGVRNFACSGRSVSTSSVRRPTTTVGIASAMYMICQPLSPNRPSRPSSPVEIGAPSATATGSPTRNPDTMRAWCLRGNQ